MIGNLRFSRASLSRQYFLESPIDDRMLLREVRAERQQALGVVEVPVAAGWAVGTEGTLVARHCGGHAQGGVAVVVVGADDAADQLAEGVELLGHDLARGKDGHGIATVLGLDALEGPGDAVQRRVPVGALPVLEGARPHFRRTAATGCREDLRLGQSLDAELAAVDVGAAHAAGGQRRAGVVDANLDGAADGAIAAGGVLPLGHGLGGDAHRVLLTSSEKHGLKRSGLLPNLDMAVDHAHRICAHGDRLVLKAPAGLEVEMLLVDRGGDDQLPLEVADDAA